MNLIMREPKIMWLDMECLPGHWIAADYVSKIVTAAAWKFSDGDGITHITHYDITPAEIALEVRYAIAGSDVVVGHYIRGFDLKLLNGELLRSSSPALPPVLTHDTKLDLLKSHGRSLSQKNLAALLGIDEPKIEVTLDSWERFNYREPGFKEKGIERVTGDVRQNFAMHQRLLELEWLGPMRVWHPESSGGGGRYHA